MKDTENERRRKDAIRSLFRQSQLAAAIIDSERKPPRRCPRPCSGEREWTTGTRYNCVCRKCGRYFKVRRATK